MNNLLIKLPKQLFIVVFFSLIFLFSCVEEELVELEAPQLIMYTPTGDLEGLSMKFVWDSLPNANYIFQISSDNFVNDIDTLVYNIDTTTISVSGLTSNTKLYARIKAVSENGSRAFADFRHSTLFLYENVFTNQTNDILSANNVTRTTVRLTWLANRNVTSMVKIFGNVSDTTQLQPSEINSRSKTFTDLEVNSDYIFKIYNNKVLRGVVAAKTNLY